MTQTSSPRRFKRSAEFFLLGLLPVALMTLVFAVLYLSPLLIHPTLESL